MVCLFVLFYGNEIHTWATVKDHIQDKIFKILYIISHNIYNNRDTFCIMKITISYLSIDC